jgi:hypothetical protein
MSKTSHEKHEHKYKKKHQDMSYEKPHEDYQVGIGGDILIGFLILGLGLFFIIPFYSYIPEGSQIIVIGLFFLVVAVFAFSVWKKRRK